jgi:hypothetical protein
MTSNPKYATSNAKGLDFLDAFNAPYAEREPSSEAPKTGLIVFSFGRNGGFNKESDESSEETSAA